MRHHLHATHLLLLTCCGFGTFLPSVHADWFEPKGDPLPVGKEPITAVLNDPVKVFGTQFPSGTKIYANRPSGRISIEQPYNEPTNYGFEAPVHLLQPFETFIQNIETYFNYANITGPLLANMSALVRANFLLKTDFNATGGHLFTWDNLKDTFAKSNTFQVAFVYDTSSTYAIYNYLQVNSHTVLGFVMTGFTRRKSTETVTLPFSGSSTLRLANASAVADGTPGRFIYRIDSWPPVRGGCLSEDPPLPRDQVLSSSLSKDSVLGGSVTILSARCPEAGSKGKCTVSLDGRVLSERPAVRCDRCSAAFWACEVPPSLRAGPANLTLKVDSHAAYSTEFIFVNPDSPIVTKIHLNDSTDNWMQTEPNSLLILYDANETLNGSLKLQVVGYSEAGLRQIDRPEDFKTLIKVLYEGPASSSGIMNLAGRTVRCQAGNTDCESYHVGFLQILDSSSPPNVIKSRIVPLGWFVHPYYVDKQSPDWFASKCTAWRASPDPVTLNYLTCPSRLNQTRANPGQYLPLTYCPTLAGACGAASPKQWCFISRPASSADVPGVPAAVCCYSESENLVYQEMRDESGSTSQYGSTSLRSHPIGLTQRSDKPVLAGQASYLSHWYWDVLPYLYCCRWAKGGLCHLNYMQSRPTPKATIYTTGSSSFLIGDPHVTAYSGRQFLFNDVGEHWLVNASGSGIAVQARFELTPLTSSATFLTAVAATTGGSIVEVTALTGSRLLVSRRQRDSTPSQSVFVSLTESDGPYSLDPGITVKFTAPDTLVLQLGSGQDGVGIYLKAMSNSTYMDIYLTLSDSLKGKTQGLLGNWTEDPTREFVDVHGKTAVYNTSWEQFDKEFCQKNRLGAADQSIFGYSGFSTRIGGFEKKNTEPQRTYKPVFTLPDSPAPDEAGVCGAVKDCQFDYRVTKNKEVAANTAANTQQFSALQAANNANVSVCNVPEVAGVFVNQVLTVGVSLSLACAAPLVASIPALSIVCTGQARGSPVWVPDPATLGVKCSLPSVVIGQANISLIVGIVVPVVVLLLIAIIVIVFIVRRRSAENKTPTEGAQPALLGGLKYPTGKPQQPGDSSGGNSESIRAGDYDHKADEGNRRNPKAMPSSQQQQQHSTSGYSGVATDSDAEGGGRSAQVPQYRHRDSYNQSQRDPVVALHDQPAMAHEQPQQQRPRKPRPVVSHSEVV